MTPQELDQTYLTGPDVYYCFVAVDPTTKRIEGFQTLGRHPTLPEDIGDIGTFARIDGTQRGVGTALFSATRARACSLGLKAINATIRSDNLGGLSFYSKRGFIDHHIVEAVPLQVGMLIDRVVKRFTLTHPRNSNGQRQTEA